VDLFSLSVGIGLVVSLVFSEILGLAAGGMVVPGYLALFLNQPLNVVLTLFAALITYLAVKGISNYVILYGKRRTALMILVGFMVGFAFRHLTVELLFQTDMMSEIHPASVSVVGFIVPGLIAIWYDRQGVVETTSVLLLASIVVRLSLILCGFELLA